MIVFKVAFVLRRQAQWWLVAFQIHLALGFSCGAWLHLWNGRGLCWSQGKDVSLCTASRPWRSFIRECHASQLHQFPWHYLQDSVWKYLRQPAPYYCAYDSGIQTQASPMTTTNFFIARCSYLSVPPFLIYLFCECFWWQCMRLIINWHYPNFHWTTFRHLSSPAWLLYNLKLHQRHHGHSVLLRRTVTLKRRNAPYGIFNWNYRMRAPQRISWDQWHLPHRFDPCIVLILHPSCYRLFSFYMLSMHYFIIISKSTSRGFGVLGFWGFGT